VYIKRHIEDAVLRRAKAKGAVVVTGARQTGKTTLIETLKPNIPKVTLDDLPTRRRAIDAPSVFFDVFPPPIFVDEVQYAPELFSYIKIHVDESKRKGDFFLTGSQRFTLMKNVSESLSGRAGILELFGLSLRELHEESFIHPFLPTLDFLLERKQSKISMGVTEVWHTIHRGCLPELVANPTFQWDEFYADYVKTYIKRDVRNLTQVADEGDFLKFMTVCAAMTGQMLNLSSLARDVGISESTAKRWMSVLQTSGLVFLLQPFSTNAIKRAVKTPKLYFLDMGLAAYLTRWMTAETLAIGAMNGHFFESYVMSEIVKSYTNAGKEAVLYFLCDSNKREIDLLLCENNTLYPIEIKLNPAPSPKDIKNFAMLDALKGVNIGEGGVICPAKDLLPLTDKHRIIPLWFI